ncbi:MAG: Thiamine biosynthesis lipoprotein ApbE precursor [Verrucomicrobiota bacterium]|jgi:thiamine biosynthesis lipoprotein
MPCATPKTEAKRSALAAVLLAFALAVSLLGSCASPPPLKAWDFHRSPVMGSDFRIVIHCAEEARAAAAAEAAFAEIARIEDLMSDYRDGSELFRLSESSCLPGGQKEPFPVSAELYDLLSWCQDLARRSDGAFDVTCGPLVRCWRMARHFRAMPPEKMRQRALAASGWSKMQLLPGHQVRLLAPNMKLDLGAVAPGYAADRALRLLEERGLPHSCVDASGDISFGQPPDAQGWAVKIEGSADPQPRSFQIFKKCAVGTSGDSVRHVDIDGLRYSHIVDPRSGLGLSNRRLVFVLAPTNREADALAMTLSVLDREPGLELLKSFPGSECLVFQEDPRDRQQWSSPGFPPLTNDKE